MKDPLEIRCFCRTKPLLAKAGRDNKTGEPFIHVRSIRNGNINAEVIAHEGTVRIRCWRCKRWHTVIIRRVSIDRKLEDLPESISVS